MVAGGREGLWTGRETLLGLGYILSITGSMFQSGDFTSKIQ